MNNNTEQLLDMIVEEFVQTLIKNGEFTTPQDLKIYVLEKLSQDHNDPSNEFPIRYYEKGEQVLEGPEYIQCAGDQLTDEFIRAAKANPQVLDGQLTLEDYQEKQKS